MAFTRAFSFAIQALGVVLFTSHVAFAQDTDESLPVSFEADAKQVKVMLGDQHFTSLIQKGFDKPILYPVFGPGQTPMVRNWPVRNDVEGEANDHPHHKSIWFSHEINHTDFWTEKGGVVETTNVKYNFKQPSLKNAIEVKSKWLKKTDSKVVLTSTATFQFGGNADVRWIDCTILFHASEGDIRFEDTKEGMFAIRTHPDLRLTPAPKRGVKEVFGSAFNSEGITGKSIWGKKAKWVVYQGKVDGEPVSMVMYDHAENLRHPTTWHARDYGLVAANPFGKKHFLGVNDGSGAFTVKKGEQLKLRYRLEFIAGMVTAETVSKRFESFIK